ncbi:MAG: DUF433 domain-containing protein [Blastocatellia bacterium]|nr:DUF433 domain-containing protein [Blastocatellia bacterium]
MNKEYVIQTDGAYRIADTRVSLDSLVYSWLQGDSPETIADNFPVLSLEQIYGAIAFYLAHQIEVDAYLRKAERDYENLQAQSRARDSALHRKLLAAKIAKNQAAA